MTSHKVEDKSARREAEPSPSDTSQASGRQTSAVDLTQAPDRDDAALPHERDQTVGMTDGVPSKTVQQAHRDMKRGLQDTSRAPEADTAYEKQKK
ncbi:hypothetical protein BH11PSE8_BH11PSE8_03870 [soil metagenome]